MRGVAARTQALEAGVFAEADLLLPLTQACADIIEYSFRAPPSASPSSRALRLLRLVRCPRERETPARSCHAVSCIAGRALTRC